LDNNPLSTSRVAKLYKTNSRNLQRNYKEKLSGFDSWIHKEHASKYLVFGKNLGKYLSLDETSLSNGELYTVLTNKQAKGQKGSIVAMIKGTMADNIINIINKIPVSRRNIVKEITVDMASNMNLIAKKCFPKATIVTDRFHVQKLAVEAVQDERIKYRWQAIEQENKDIKLSREQSQIFVAETFENGDTRRQLLARSRYLLFKSPDKWTNSQKLRAEILFNEYPTIKKAYTLAQGLTQIFNKNNDKNTARVKLALWYNEVEESGFKSFNTIANSIFNHYDKILNYFNNRSTNASAESFNAKIKEFRRQFRGVKDVEFFLFRLCKLYA
jgi:transposase